MHSVLAVILNWNGLQLTRRCVEHIRAQSRSVDILVIDNGSVDGSAEYLTNELAAGEFLALPRNIGYAAGMNAGIERAVKDGYRFVWLLNSDAFPTRGCLEALIDELEQNEQSGVATPILIGEDGVPQEMGGSVSLEDFAVTLFRLSPIRGKLPDGCWFAGAAPLVRVSCLQDVGLFFEGMFAYFEDWDLWARMESKGWSRHFVPDAVCIHLEGSSSGGPLSPFATYLLNRNRWLFIRRRLRSRRRISALLRVLSQVIRHSGYASANGDHKRAAALAAAAWAILTRKVGAPRSISSPRLFERLVRRHSWGIARWLEHTAILLSRVMPSSEAATGGARP